MAGLRPGKKRGKNGGKGAAAASLGFGHAPFFFVNVFFFVGFLVMVFSWGFLYFFVFFLCFFLYIVSPLFCAYTEICIYSARVPSRVRNKVSIKLILFFEV
jgi:hypothetical protein